MPVPEVDTSGLPLASGSAATPAPGTATPARTEQRVVTQPTRWDVERIVSAEHVGGGWTLTVKWRGFSETTREPASAMERDLRRDPDLTDQISRCKEQYLDSNPAVRAQLDARRDALRSSHARPTPTRILPERATRARVDRYQASVLPEPDSAFDFHVMTVEPDPKLSAATDAGLADFACRVDQLTRAWRTCVDDQHHYLRDFEWHRGATLPPLELEGVM